MYIMGLNNHQFLQLWEALWIQKREKKEIFALLGLTVFEKKKHRLGVFAEQCTGLHLIN